ncbi:hypothetical protein NKF06_14555 [Haloferax sp. AB510]|uniref:hypothetical protein n=1 Tax=Haloferax sp. AB510 TaxID=2934172 RepID=UPI00209C5981|nr:hypothetical protein [Haloferax sp. AB510]MCO8267771.1 hypothetical protein [Haloferax sp. AB510]
MPGIVATRAPASVAASRARVCVSDALVGQTTISADAMARATESGGSIPFRSIGGISNRPDSKPSSTPASNNARPMWFVSVSVTTRSVSPGAAFMFSARSRVATSR